MLPRLSLVLPAVPEGVPRARDAVTDLCERLGLERDLADDIRLAVTEACANCVLHSTENAAHPTFVLDAHIEQAELVIVVRDFGGGLLRAPIGSGGLGLGMKLIEDLCERSQVSSRPGGGTRVSMRFGVPPEKATSAEGLNPRGLGDEEVDAVRGLQSGTNRLPADDPVWTALRAAGLVRRKGANVPVWSLTMRGRLYRTG